MRIFLAGATGVIGRRLVPLLVAAGHHVTGTTRSPDKAAALTTLGAESCVVDVYDADRLAAAVIAARPDVVIHQLTDLPQVLAPDAPPEVFARNARVRVEGTPNLIAAALAAKVSRLVVQSIAFAYAPGPEPHGEDDPLNSGISADAVATMERLATATPGIAGLVLRYGRLYGPGTWAAQPDGKGFVHVDAAAQAALLAVTRGAPGLYNIAEDDGAVSIAKARAGLGFDPAFRAA